MTFLWPYLKNAYQAAGDDPQADSPVYNQQTVAAHPLWAQPFPTVPVLSGAPG